MTIDLSSQPEQGPQAGALNSPPQAGALNSPQAGALSETPQGQIVHIENANTGPETVADGQGLTQLGREATLRIERNRAAALARRAQNLEVQRGDPSTGLVQEVLASTQHQSTSPAMPRPMCVICQFGFDYEEEILALPCAHTFHSECIQRWATTRAVGLEASCPLCKSAPPVLDVADTIDEVEEPEHPIAMDESDIQANAETRAALDAMN